MNPLFYAQQIAYSSKETLRFTYETAKKFKDTPGVYVECGVAAGAQIIAMAYGAPNKTIIACDSFKGIPLPSNRDDQMPGLRKLSSWEQKALPDPGKQALESSGSTVVSEFAFWTHVCNAFGIKPVQWDPAYDDKYIRCIPELNIATLPGWFEETLYTIDAGPIVILRLDGDLYNSTFECLKYLFPHCINGACVIIDDWTLKGCRDACNEYFALIGYEPDYKFLDGTAYFFK